MREARVDGDGMDVLPVPTDDAVLGFKWGSLGLLAPAQEGMVAFGDGGSAPGEGAMPPLSRDRPEDSFGRLEAVTYSRGKKGELTYW